MSAALENDVRNLPARERRPVEAKPEGRKDSAQEQLAAFDKQFKLLEAKLGQLEQILDSYRSDDVVDAKERQAEAEQQAEIKKEILDVARQLDEIDLNRWEYQMAEQSRQPKSGGFAMKPAPHEHQLGALNRQLETAYASNDDGAIAAIQSQMATMMSEDGLAHDGVTEQPAQPPELSEEQAEALDRVEQESSRRDEAKRKQEATDVWLESESHGFKAAGLADRLRNLDRQYNELPETLRRLDQDINEASAKLAKLQKEGITTAHIAKLEQDLARKEAKWNRQWQELRTEKAAATKERDRFMEKLVAFHSPELRDLQATNYDLSGGASFGQIDTLKREWEENKKQLDGLGQRPQGIWSSLIGKGRSWDRQRQQLQSRHAVLQSALREFEAAKATALQVGVDFREKDRELRAQERGLENLVQNPILTEKNVAENVLVIARGKQQAETNFQVEVAARLQELRNRRTTLLGWGANSYHKEAQALRDKLQAAQASYQEKRKKYQQKAGDNAWRQTTSSYRSTRKMSARGMK